MATIKYYRREGLLPEGRALNPTTVEYDEEHIQRLRLIRFLIQLGGLSVARTREVLEAVDRPLDAFETLGVVHHALPVPSAETNERKDEGAEGTVGEEASCRAAARVEALIATMG
ncbi:MerR family transcriptional regulator [Streptomyces coeruleorubidus]